jgi:hypothetical protein
VLKNKNQNEFGFVVGNLRGVFAFQIGLWPTLDMKLMCFFEIK